MEPTNPIDHVPGIIERLYTLVGELEKHFPGRKFTPDGHLVGSLGEVLAAYYYELGLLSASTERHDARARDGRMVQVKATQGKSVALRSEPVSNSVGPGLCSFAVRKLLRKDGLATALLVCRGESSVIRTHEASPESRDRRPDPPSSSSLRLDELHGTDT